MKPTLLLVSTALLFGSVQAAPDMEAATHDLKCYYCHQTEGYLHAPSFRDIASRYSANKTVMTDVLAAKIVHGGAGNWGVVPMVANDHVSPQQAKDLAVWILSLKQK
jgi:cytochrome c